MNGIVTINHHHLPVKEYRDQRVVTLKDIDTVHERPDGTARKRFNDNKKHFIDGTDFFKMTPSEFRTAIGDMDLRQQNDVTLITESGYLMLVKSFTDDLAWQVQRQLINSYFKFKEKLHEPSLSIEDAFRLAELINSTPPDKLPIIGAVFLQAGVHIPEIDTHTDNTQSHHDTGRKVPAYSSNEHVANFLQGVNVINRPTNEVYQEYIGYCSKHGISPVSNIAFSKMVNKASGTCVIQKKIDRVNRKVFAQQGGR